MNVICFTQSISDNLRWICLNLVHQRLGQWLVQSYISLQLPRPIIPLVQFTMVQWRWEQFDLTTNSSLLSHFFPGSRAEAPLPCKIPLYNPNNPEQPNKINHFPQSHHSLLPLCCKQSSSLEPMPFGIVAFTNFSLLPSKDKPALQGNSVEQLKDYMTALVAACNGPLLCLSHCFDQTERM